MAERTKSSTESLLGRRSQARAEEANLERAAAAIEDFLRALGVPEDNPELVGTGARVAEAFAHDLLAGYGMDPRELLSDATASDAPGLVVVRDLGVATMCPHHLMPATGTADVAYLPGGRVVGFGAIGHLVDGFARRLVLQEDLGREVANSLAHHLNARAACCILRLAPTCMTIRGGRRHGATAVTYAWAGPESHEPLFQQQVLSAIRG